MLVLLPRQASTSSTPRPPRPARPARRSRTSAAATSGRSTTATTSSSANAGRHRHHAPDDDARLRRRSHHRPRRPHRLHQRARRRHGDLLDERRRRRRAAPDAPAGPRRRPVLLARRHADRVPRAPARAGARSWTTTRRCCGDGLWRPTSLEIFVMNADGSNLRQVTSLGGASFAPFFTPDGKRIIFASNHHNPQRARLRAVPRSTSTAPASSASRTTRRSTASRCSRPTAQELVFASNRISEAGRHERLHR